MISIIVAIAKNGVIGGDNELLWHISEDLRRFRQITTGHPVIMGRKTYESIGKPLPNRTNVIITRNPDYDADGCIICGSLEQAVAMFGQGEVFVIGGGEIYRQAMPIADKLYITWVEHEYGGDTFFPDLDLTQWQLIKEEHHKRGEKYPYPFIFCDYKRKK